MADDDAVVGGASVSSTREEERRDWEIRIRWGETVNYEERCCARRRCCRFPLLQRILLHVYEFNGQGLWEKEKGSTVRYHVYFLKPAMSAEAVSNGS